MNDSKNKLKKKINNNEIEKFDILTSYDIEYEKNEKIYIKHIFIELFLIKELFNTENVIEILKLFRYKNNNKYIKIFSNIFKMMSEEYINNYEYLIIIFDLLKLYKNKHNILIKNIDINNFFILLKNYLLLLSSKSELLKLLLLLGKTNIVSTDFKLLFTMLSKELSNYISFDQLHYKLFDCVHITDFNKDIINKNKKKYNMYYNEINKNLNDIYDFDNYNKYKVSHEIINYFNNIIDNSKKIIIIE